MSGIHQWPVDSPHKRSVTGEVFPFDDIIIFTKYLHTPANVTTHQYLGFKLVWLWAWMSNYVLYNFMTIIIHPFHHEARLTKIGSWQKLFEILFSLGLAPRIFILNKTVTFNKLIKTSPTTHNDVINWKHFPRNWPYVRRIHRSSVNSPHKGQRRGALMFSLICAWPNSWANTRIAGDLRRNRAHFDLTVMPYTPAKMVMESHVMRTFVCNFEAVHQLKCYSFWN